MGLMVELSLWNTHTSHVHHVSDHQLLDELSEPFIAQEAEDLYVFNSPSTGEHDCGTLAHLKEMQPTLSQATPDGKGKSFICSVLRCDRKAVTGERGVKIIPCEQDFKICYEFFREIFRCDLSWKVPYTHLLGYQTRRECFRDEVNGVAGWRGWVQMISMTRTGCSRQKEVMDIEALCGPKLI